MEKIVLFFLVIIFSSANELSNSSELNRFCLNCHLKKQIPDKIVYKRYLVKYSTKKRIKEIMVNYLKNPNSKNSIMPPPFFLRFPIKKATNLDNKKLNYLIEQYLDKFDIKKRIK